MVTSADVLAFADRRIRQRRRGLVANHNLHSLYLLRRTPGLRRFYAMADLVEIDSTPMILWARLLGRPVERRHRCTYLDWREDFWRLASVLGWRVFYHRRRAGAWRSGGAQAIRRRWPGAVIAAHHGHFDMRGPQNEAILAEIAAFRPDVLLGGHGHAPPGGVDRRRLCRAAAVRGVSRGRGLRLRGWRGADPAALDGPAGGWSGCSGWPPSPAASPAATWWSPGAWSARRSAT